MWCSLTELNLTGFTGAAHEHGLLVHEVNVRLQQKTPFALYGWQAVVKARHGGAKRGRDGGERRQRLVLFDMIRECDLIMIAEALVEDDAGRVLNKHAIVWDGWRRLLFIGPGAYDDRGLDGALLLNEADCNSAEHVDTEHGMTVSRYVHERFGIRHFTNMHVLMVSGKKAHLTNHA